MRKRRTINSSSLSFLDIMACGLGAVILLFFIIDFQETPEIPDDIANNNIVSNEEQVLRINEMKDREKILSDEINQMSQQLAKAIEEEVQLSIVSAPMDQDQIKSQIVNANNKPGSLIGLTIEGPEILVLLDTSASMAYPKLVDIILGIDEETGGYLKKGKKWQQAQNIGRWLIENAPKKSKIRSLGFSDKIIFADNSWLSRSDALLSFNANLRDLGPQGGTSLAAPLEYIVNSKMNPSDIYLITDGLPTLSGELSSNNIFNRIRRKIKGCGSLKSTSKLVDGKCRRNLFLNAVTEFQAVSSAKVNVILLPLEGDPDGAPLYQKWTAQLGGSFLSPSEDWLK